MLEDVSITNDYPFLIWLMCASSKNFILSDYLVIKILNIIKQMCNHKIKTNYKKEIKHFNILDKEFKNVEEKLLIWCLELRRSYGGLKGDIQMINWYSNYVFNNNNNKKKSINYHH